MMRIRSSVILPLAVSGEYRAQWFPQLIDHVDRLTFWQRYFMNADHYRSGGPGFLYVVGEQAVQNYTVSEGLIVDLAKEHGGVVYALEHRFYGLSQPFSSLRTETLKTLHSEYAITDLVRFTKSISDPITGKPDPERRWFLIGGSYGGTLAAWARQSRPDVFFGALASSAPLVAQEDFPEYDQAIGRVLGPRCSKHMAAIVEYVDALYDKGKGFNELKEILGCSSLDDIHFLYTFYDSVALIVQYDSPFSDPSIATLCHRIDTDHVPTGLSNLVNVITTFYRNEGATCTQFANHKDLKQIRIHETAQIRQWNYQCCTEFGFWQSAPKHGRAMRSKHLTKEWFNKFFCSQSLYSWSIGPPDTQRTNFRHAGKYIGTQRIIFTNGANDPWAHLSLSDPGLSSPERPVILIRNASHTADLAEPNDSDHPDLKRARATIKATFRRWVRYPA